MARNLVNINQRRYLGNKYKLTDFIRETVEKNCSEVTSVFDVFAGTGAVSATFSDKTLLTNDILYSNYMAHIAWFSPLKFCKSKIKSIIKEFNNLKEDDLPENYLSLNYSDTYFSHKTCLKAGWIRDKIETLFEEHKINSKERAILITSLIYALDRIANTCGHYDAFRKNVECKGEFVLPELSFIGGLSKSNKCYNEDSNVLSERVKADLAYLDPPYNSRQYSDAYHLLENIAKWEKPRVYGVAKKMDRKELKSKYCTKDAVFAFEELVTKLNCKYILLSYNNTGTSSDDRSNARISDEDIIRILSKRGNVQVFTQHYKAFTAGKSHNEKNEERLFLCTIYKDSLVQSPLNYTGGKFKLLPQLLAFFPSRIDTFVDLMCGGCSVGLNVTADRHIYNDIDPHLTGLLKTIKEESEEEFLLGIEQIINKYNLSFSLYNSYETYGCSSSAGLSSYNKDYFLNLRKDFNNLKNKDSTYYKMLFVLIIYSFNNQIRFNKDDNFNLPVGKRDFNSSTKKKLHSFTVRLKEQNSEIQNCSFETFDTANLSKDSLVYCDPPYLISDATYNENGGWTQDLEKRLLFFLDSLNSRGIKFALSNMLSHGDSRNFILEEWIEKKKYCVHHLEYSYSNSNYHRKNKCIISDEVLITNY